MRFFLLLLVSCGLVPTFAASAAGDFREIAAPGFGVTLALPAAFQAGESGDGIHFVIEGPQGRYRLHWANGKDATPLAALARSESLREKLAEEKEKPAVVYMLQGFSDFTTASGIRGARGEFGVRRGEVPALVSYYLPGADGRVLCICVDRAATREDFDLLGQWLIASCRHTPATPDE